MVFESESTMRRGRAMPLHDWSGQPGWEGVHHLWITELLRWIKPRLPEGYRAYIGSTPLLAVGAPAGRPDVAVRSWSPPRESESGRTEGRSGEPDLSPPEPDEEIAVATLDPETAVFVERQGVLIAAVEMISPRHKDRPFARSACVARYLGYLLDGANLMLIDVHPHPRAFSFADQIAAQLQVEQPPVAPPLAVSYRVGEPAPSGGRFLAIWRRPLTAGAPLPNLPLPLTPEQAVAIDLETTYSRAAADAYLE
jgi:hypothetical protein